MKQNKISSSLEDYLEAIAEISELGGHAHSKDIAGRLHVSMPSVSNALQALAASELISYQPHVPVTLTEKGRKMAALIRHRHAAMEKFFAEILKFSLAEASLAACEVEHILGEKFIARFIALAEAIENRQDCAGLRDYLARKMPFTGLEENEAMIALHQLPLGVSAVIVDLDEQQVPVASLSFASNFFKGIVLQLEKRLPDSGQLQVRIMESRLNISEKLAQHILVRLQPELTE